MGPKSFLGHPRSLQDGTVVELDQEKSRTAGGSLEVWKTPAVFSSDAGSHSEAARPTPDVI